MQSGQHYWGSGLSHYETKHTSLHKLPGKNIMGVILMAVRDILIEGEIKGDSEDVDEELDVWENTTSESGVNNSVPSAETSTSTSSTTTPMKAATFFYDILSGKRKSSKSPPNDRLLKAANILLEKTSKLPTQNIALGEPSTTANTVKETNIT